MNDTSPFIEREIRARMSMLAPDIRMEMGSLMFDASREMVLASFPESLAPAEQRVALFMRVYSQDFDEKQQLDIIRHLAETTS
jgi:hypothetical protein